MRFCYNVARLFVNIVGCTTFLVLSIFVVGRYIEQLSKPVYQPAAKAVYYYRPGHPGCDFMHGAVLHAKVHDRLLITFVEVPNTPENNSSIPMVCFFDKDGNEIKESRMSGLWSLYDINIRFGIDTSVGG